MKATLYHGFRFPNAIIQHAIWLYLRGDYLGVGIAIVAGVIALAYTSVNLFVRQWP